LKYVKEGGLPVEVCEGVTSRPPMSSQVMLGTSTTVSRSDDGLDTPSAYLKCSCDTAMEFSTW
jgi:hypothetical protein